MEAGGRTSQFWEAKKENPKLRLWSLDETRGEVTRGLRRGVG